MRFLLFLFIMMAMVNGMFIGYDIGKRTVKKDGKEHVFIHESNPWRAVLVVIAGAVVACMVRLRLARKIQCAL